VREHVSTHDPRTEILEASRCEFLVYSCFSVVLALHCPECARWQKPFVEIFSTGSHRLFQRLIGAGTVPIERN
jgi:hypothetical protein